MKKADIVDPKYSLVHLSIVIPFRGTKTAGSAGEVPHCPNHLERFRKLQTVISLWIGYVDSSANTPTTTKTIACV